MRHIVQWYMNESGMQDRVDRVKKKTGIDPILWDTLRYKTLGPWFQNTTLWLDLLEDPYFTNRILEQKKLDKDYAPHMVIYMPIFHVDAETTIAFLKKLDDAATKATGDIFPDHLLEVAFPPKGGPYLDLLKIIAKEDKTVPRGLIDPRILLLGLQFSRLPKDIENLSTITRRDIDFLGQFICQLAGDTKLTEQLLSIIDNIDIFGLCLIAIRPEHPLQALDYDASLVTSGLEEVSNTLKLCKENPRFVQEAYKA